MLLTPLLALARGGSGDHSGGSVSVSGYVVDHIIALKRGGKDDSSNMQWQTTADAKAKTNGSKPGATVSFVYPNNTFLVMGDVKPI